MAKKVILISLLLLAGCFLLSVGIDLLKENSPKIAHWEILTEGFPSLYIAYADGSAKIRFKLNDEDMERYHIRSFAVDIANPRKK